MAPKTKVIVAGDLRGNLAPVVARVGKLNAAGKGPFGVVFCVGAFARNGDAARVEQSRAEVEDKRAVHWRLPGKHRDRGRLRPAVLPLDEVL